MKILICIPSLMLLALLLIPLSRVGSRTRWVAKHVMTGAALAILVGAIGLVMNLWSGPVIWKGFVSWVAVGWAPGILLDGFGSLLMMMIGFVGWHVARYAIRNLTDDAGQGLFLKWTGITAGSILMAVVASNLVQMLLAFLLSGLSVHRLLTHHGNRPEAVRTAWTKFSLNRLADLLFLVAVVQLYRIYGTLDLQELYQSVQAGASQTASSEWAALFLALGAMIRSVQFPFHVWLPGSLEAPTPVSALLHAGVVNAGGMILIRSYPILATAPWVLGLLVIVGAITALTAALTMATQTTIKRQLVHGTVSQMGFMVMQCGLGCPAAALMHILAHSLYKAHAFLASGDAWLMRANPVQTKPLGRIEILGLGSLVALFAWGALYLMGKNPSGHSGLLLLGMILGLSVMGWFRTHGLEPRVLIQKVLPLVGVLLVTYFGLHALSHDLLLQVWGHSVEYRPEAWLLVTIGLSFLALFGIEHRWMHPDFPSCGETLRIHARNGFYLDFLWKRLVSTFQS